ncbi:MAG: HXXEE domain-containing protein [Planctomycetota bacterium]
MSTRRLTAHHIAVSALAVLTLALFVPSAGTAFLVDHWMRVGTYAAPMLILVACAFRSDQAHWQPRDWALAMLVAYIVHQFEEHWIDLYGRNYAFIDSVNAMFPEADPLTPEGVYVINAALVWLVGLQAVVWAKTSLRPVGALFGIVVTNAPAHVVAAVVQGAYNPGLATALAVFVPVGVLAARSLAAVSGGRGALWFGLAYGVFGHALMVGGLVASGVIGIFPESVYFAGLVAYSLVPTLSVVLATDRHVVPSR